MTGLTLVMIVGVITIVVLLVIRLNRPPPPLALPDAIALPSGAEAGAVTVGRGFVLVLTSDDRALVYAPDGTLRDTIEIE